MLTNKFVCDGLLLKVLDTQLLTTKILQKVGDVILVSLLLTLNTLSALTYNLGQNNL